jgi:hypothetical protein
VSPVLKIKAAPDDLDATADRVWALLDRNLLAKVGYSFTDHVLKPPARHEILGYQACPIKGCENWSYTINKLCWACDTRFRLSGRPAMECFLRIPRPRFVENLCTVCRTPGHERPAHTNGLCQSCEAHRRHHLVSPRAYVNGDKRFPPAQPRIGFGPCTIDGCDRAAGRADGLCHLHITRCARAERAGMDREDWAARQGLPGVRPQDQFILTGLHRLVEGQVLFGFQVAVAEERRTPPHFVNPLLDYLRNSEATDLFEVHDVVTSHVSGGIHAQRFLALVRDRLSVALTDIETETAKDVWDLRVWEAMTGRLDFSAISQPWLRQLAQNYCVENLPNQKSRAMVDRVVKAARHLSTSLRRRKDRGDDPAALTRTDLNALLARLMGMERRGSMTMMARSVTVANLSLLLRFARESRMTIAGGPLAALDHDFLLTKKDVVRRPCRDIEDDVGQSLPTVVMEQLVAPEALAVLEQLSGGQGRRAVGLQMRIGRRTGELMGLRFNCLDHDESVDEEGATRLAPVLVHDMPKVERYGCRLPIGQDEAELIRAQQDYVRGRYPKTPLADLVLFPRWTKNLGGTKSISKTYLANIIRSWLKVLPELDSGERRKDGTVVPFDKNKIFPYSFRHSYAQRHADAGTDLVVLAELMGHSNLQTTKGYFKVTTRRKRAAADRLACFTLDNHGVRTRPAVLALLDAEATREHVGQVAVPFGVCTEASNVKAGGMECPFRHRCFGCVFYRTDPSYQPELRAYLTELLKQREHLAASVPQLEEWARREAMPSDDEIEAVRNLIRSNAAQLLELEPADRAAVEEAIAIARGARSQLATTFPVQFRGVVAQTAPVLFPTHGRPRATPADGEAGSFG